MASVRRLSPPGWCDVRVWGNGEVHCAEPEDKASSQKVKQRDAEIRRETDKGREKERNL